MEIPLMKNNIIHFVNSDDILYVRSDKHQITIRTYEGEYHPLRTLHDFQQLLHFEQVDKSAIIQLKNVTEYDPFHRVVYFRQSSIELRCFVSRRNAQKIKRHIEH